MRETFYICLKKFLIKMKILIIRFSSFGDVVLTTPVITAIKEKYPNAKIDFIVYTTFSQAISLNPKIENVILFDKKKSKDKIYIEDIIKKLKKENYDYVIDLHSKILSRIIGKSISNKNTKYLKYKKRKWWKTLLVKAKMIPYNADCTIVESYFTALKKMDIQFSNKNILSGNGDGLEFFIDKDEEEKIVKKYDLKNRKYAVLASGASKFTKKWVYYDELAKKIVNNNELSVIAVGGKEDFSDILENEKVLNLCGKLSFKESAVIMKYSQFVVANDSGPFHIARALKCKIFVFFGPTDPKLFSFEKDTHLIYNKNCKPHSLYGDDKFPKKYENCMKDIKVEEVYEKIFKNYRKEENISKNKVF